MNLSRNSHVPQIRRAALRPLLKASRLPDDTGDLAGLRGVNLDEKRLFTGIARPVTNSVVPTVVRRQQTLQVLVDIDAACHRSGVFRTNFPFVSG